MEDVISKLAEIEAAASRIMEDVAVQKKKLSEENDAQIKAFDEEADRKTAKELESIRRDREVNMEKELDNQKAETDEILHKMEKYYEAHHEEMAQKLYDKILRM